MFHTITGISSLYENFNLSQGSGEEIDREAGVGGVKLS
jgi:hypothetical protein